MKRLMTVAALALVTACAAQARTEARTELPPSAAPVVVAEAARAAPEASPLPAVACDIRVTRTAHGLRLEAIAHADRSVHGSYDFVITAQGSGGSSDVTQGGPFDLAAGRSATVGVAEISHRRYRAVLTLSDADGEICRLERRS